jgi:LuxR family transcriptional regulator
MNEEPSCRFVFRTLSRTSPDSGVRWKWKSHARASGEIASGAAELLKEHAGTAIGLGFPYMTLCLRLRLPIETRDILVVCNYVGTSWAAILASEIATQDPSQFTTVGKVTRTNSIDSRGEGEETSSSIATWSRAMLALPGCEVTVGLSRLATAEFLEDLKENFFRVSSLADELSLLARRHLLPMYLPDIGQPLATREADVLRWAAGGKTADEIASILEISTRTVNFHIGRSIAKMNAANRTAAVVKAALFDLL